MDEINQSIEFVVKNAKHVTIDMQNSQKFVDSVLPEEFESSDLKGKGSLSLDFTPEDCIAYAIVNGALQFCFWGDPKWTIDIDGQKYDGGDGLIQSIKRGIAEGYQLLNAKYLSSISEEDFAHIVRGTPMIPLFYERLAMLREIGRVVSEKYSGRFSNIIEASGGDLCKLVRILVTDMPDVFDDSIMYEEKKVYFYKRVQLTVMYIEDLSRRDRIPYKMFNRNLLTGLADYKAPQMLRVLGILKYDDKLSNLIDNKIEIQAGSDYEVELRACTIKADELVAEELKKKFSIATPDQVHKILWFRSQKITDIKPYHRTRTIWY